MSLDRLWAGWRQEFVSGGTSDDHGGTAESGEDHDEGLRIRTRVAEAGGQPTCVFCRILLGGLPDEETHVLWRDPDGRAAAVLNAYPYTSGHLMVMPVRHTGEIETLSDEEGLAVMHGVKQAIEAIKAAYQPAGLNLGANLGTAAGAGIPDHAHVHVLPRWGGDTNFMTSVADTRVLPETLSSSAKRLRAAWPKR